MRPGSAVPTAPPDESPVNGSPVNDQHVKRARTRTILSVVAVLVCLCAVAVVAGAKHRLSNKRALAQTAQLAGAAPTVDVIRPVPATGASLSLPGTTQAISDTIIYARTSGYLSERYVDIGDVVKAGQLLAEIESPEVDQQLTQARADLQQSIKNLDLQEANLDLAHVTMERYTSADKENAVAKALVDQQVAAYRSSQASGAAVEAAVESNRANVQRYEQLTSFERVLAPFEGTITQRNVDV